MLGSKHESNVICNLVGANDELRQTGIELQAVGQCLCTLHANSIVFQVQAGYRLIQGACFSQDLCSGWADFIVIKVENRQTGIDPQNSRLMLRMPSIQNLQPINGLCFPYACFTLNCKHQQPPIGMIFTLNWVNTTTHTGVM